jgi:hypothetical protein
MPWAAGRSLPKLTASICASVTPSSLSDLATDSARFWPSARLYSLPPRSSVWPSMVSFLALSVDRALAWPSMTGRNSSLITKLS